VEKREEHMMTPKRDRNTRSRKLEPKLEWCYEGDWPKWRQPPLAAIWQKPKSARKSAACYFGILQNAVENIFQLTPVERLRQLIEYLERQKNGRNTHLAKRFANLVSALETIDDDWQADGTADRIAYHADLYIEMMLPRYLNAMLHQLSVEGLLSCTPFQDAQGLKRPMRVAAGLPKEMSKKVDDLIMEVHSSLIAAPRKKRNKVTPGGSSSKLSKQEAMLLYWYESLHPIWRDAKTIYKANPTKVGRDAVVEKYQSNFSGENSNAGSRRDGLPHQLVDKLTAGDVYESSAEQLAYRHAAFMCGFGVDEYSVKQIKRVVAAYKKRVKASGLFGKKLERRSSRDSQE
jgi:hypothetical protein